jgi:hypothetical protein
MFEGSVPTAVGLKTVTMEVSTMTETAGHIFSLSVAHPATRQEAAATRKSLRKILDIGPDDKGMEKN